MNTFFCQKKVQNPYSVFWHNGLMNGRDLQKKINGLISKQKNDFIC